MQTLKYQVHVSNIGWMPVVKDGEIAGTIGQNKPVEALRIVDMAIPGLGINGFAHVQDIGWSQGNIQGQDIGSTGLNKHIEAIKLDLFGDKAKDYQLWYRVHVQDIGFMDWVRQGEVAGTVGGNKQIEAVQIILAKASENIWLASNTTEPYRKIERPKPQPVEQKASPEQVLNYARSWLGYLAEEDNVFGVDNYCIKWVSVCLRNNGINFPDTAWCQDGVDWAIDNGRWTSTPQSGFPVAFDWDGNGTANHFGFVESVGNDGNMYTLEANTSGVNGTGIYRKVRAISDAMGFINPY